MITKLSYFDVNMHLPYPIGEAGKSTPLSFKTPAPDVNAFLFYLDMIGVDLKLIDEITQYEVAKTKGRTRIDFKMIRVVKGVELNTWRATYFRVYKRKLKDKFKSPRP